MTDRNSLLLRCEQCMGNQLLYVVAGPTVMVACKTCLHIDQRPLTPELQAAIHKQMGEASPWKERKETN